MIQKGGTRICFVNATNPNFIGGVSLYQKRLIENIDLRQYNITWIYKGRQNRKYDKNGIKYMEIKVPKLYFWNEVVFNRKVLRHLNKERYDIINSHALWGYWMRKYRGRKGSKIIHTYHGVAYPYYKIQLKKYNFAIRFLLTILILPFGFLMERVPMKYADEIICVSEKVRRDLEKIYGKRRNIDVVRTGVDISKFRNFNKKLSLKKIGLEGKYSYGIFVGKGGYWIKGLDRALLIAERIYDKNKDFRLILIGPDKSKVGKMINRDFIIYKKSVDNSDIPNYYAVSDIFFCMSRYEGGAPTLSLSEAMASGCLAICSKDSEQEIIQDLKSGIIIDKFDSKDALKVIEVLGNKLKKDKIVTKSRKIVKEISLEKWSKRYLRLLLK